MIKISKDILVGMLEEILYDAKEKDSIYNEISLQFQLGEKIKKYIDDDKVCVEYERNIKYFEIYNEKDEKSRKKYNKSEIDIVIYEKGKEKDIKSEKYAIELKYPAHRKWLSKSEKYIDGEYPYRMKQFIEDIIFMDKLKKDGFTKTFCIVFVDDDGFHTGNIELENEIYQCFRKQNDNSQLKEISGIIKVPTKKNKNAVIDLKDVTPQTIKWNYISSNKELAYYILEF